MAQGGKGDPEVLERLGELLALYREVLEACEAEKQQVGSELRQLRQASAGAGRIRTQSDCLAPVGGPSAASVWMPPHLRSVG